MVGTSLTGLGYRSIGKSIASMPVITNGCSAENSPVQSSSPSSASLPHAREHATCLPLRKACASVNLKLICKKDFNERNQLNYFSLYLIVTKRRCARLCGVG
jgi:hypothetical protein